MLIHTYFTDGFFGFGKIFIQSFKRFHGEKMPLILTTRNLSDKQINELKSMYENVTILNKKINLDEISRKTNISVKRLRQFKRQIETECINKNNVIWKQYISVEDRYRNSIVEAMHYKGDENYMMHIDADSFIKKDLAPIFNIIENNDITLIFRHRSKINRKIFGCLSGYKLGDKSDLFMKKWIEKIDQKKLIEKPAGYGQTSCYLAYKDLTSSNIKWGSIPNELVKSNQTKTSIIWSGNHSRGKTRTARLFTEELKI